MFFFKHLDELFEMASLWGCICTSMLLVEHILSCSAVTSVPFFFLGNRAIFFHKDTAFECRRNFFLVKEDNGKSVRKLPF